MKERKICKSDTLGRVPVGGGEESFNIVKDFYPILQTQEVPGEATWSSSGELCQRIFWAKGPKFCLNIEDSTCLMTLR